MSNLIERFIDWCYDLTPEWVGVVVLTKGYISLVFLVVILYAFYLALFKQGE